MSLSEVILISSQLILELLLLGHLLHILEMFKGDQNSVFQGRMGNSTVSHPTTGRRVCSAGSAGLRCWSITGIYQLGTHDQGSVLMRSKHRISAVCYKNAKHLQTSASIIVRCTACRHFSVLNCFPLLSLQSLNSLKTKTSTIMQ